MNTNQKNSIVFFFPYHRVSGVPVLFFRFAKALSKRGNNVIIVDFKNGYMARKLDKFKEIKLIKYKKDSEIILPKNSTIIFQSILPETIPTNLKFHKSNKIIFWTLYQANFIQTIIPIDAIKNYQYNNSKFFKFFSKTIFRHHTNRLINTINLMHKKKALFFMSQDTFEFTSRLLDLNFSKPLLAPVCLNDIESDIKYSNIINDTINILWIGRLDNFKIHILNYFIRSLNNSKYLKTYNFNLKIIGDGNHIFSLPKHKHKNFKIKHYKKIDHDELQEYIIKSDLFAGMGTSVLEAARYGIPSLCLDFYYKKINFPYSFNWFFEKKKYDLGALIQSEKYIKNNNELDNRLSELLGDKKNISQKTKLYFKNNHSLDNYISTFEKEINSSSFYYTDFDNKVLKKSLTRRAYSKIKSIFVEEIW
tara:strand:+ start:13678 stop:14937 length:1260 start_codon:yes stop_codon:yes gene_type:complete